MSAVDPTVPERRPPGVSRRGRAGAGRWRIGLVVVLLGALVVASPSRGQRGIDGRERMHTFMTEGPAAGLWQMHTLDGIAEWLVGAHPKDAGCVLVARLDESGKSRPVQVWSRNRVARFFVPGEEDLFFRNYRQFGALVLEEGPGRGFRSTWVPRHEWGGETGRSVWVDPVSHEVVRFEDRSWEGNCVRCLLRLSPEDPDLALPEEPMEDVQCGYREWASKPPDLGRLAAIVPFPLLEPTWLPPGFELVAANYRAFVFQEHDGESEDEGDEGRTVRLAWLAYSDGLADISLGIALPADMDALEAAVAAQPDRSGEDSEACPPIPEPVPPVAAGGVLIRRRRDHCRTVLRLDGRQGVSVSLLGRNEIPEDEYIHVISSVARVVPELAGGGTRPARDGD